MNKYIIFTATVTSVLLFSGCTQQVASPNPNGVDGSGATMVASDTVTLGGSGVDGSGGNNGSGGANSVYFAYDSNKIKVNEKAKIARDANRLKNQNQVKIEGNSDEFGTDEYNYALGLRRAKAVKDNMVARGISAKKIKVVSYGESNPACTDPTQACYQQNRRADYE